ncbi:MAG TPA: response regulator [Methylomirabilota bacterium]|jgi:PAS domain S-box-containing protein
MRELLLVEDNLLVAQMLVDSLGQGSDFRVRHAASLSEALRELETHRRSIDVVLLDLTLPDSSGLATFTKIHAAAPHLPMVVLSGDDDWETAVRAVQAGAQDYLVKGATTPAMFTRALGYAIERKRVLEELRAVQSELMQESEAVRRAEENYRSFFERNLAGIFRVDLTDRVVECNPAFAEILDHATPAAVRGHNVAEFCEDGDEWHRIRGDVRPDHAVTNREVRFRRRDGTGIWVLMNVVARTARDGDGFEGQVFDITAHKRAENAERTTEALRAVAQLAAAAAHEINNPLAVMMADLQTFARDPALDANARRRVERALEAGLRIRDIIIRMRHVTRLDLDERHPTLTAMLDLTRSSPHAEGTPTD